MAIEWTWPVAVGATGGMLEVALGVWVYGVSPRSFVNRGFAFYLAATGLGDVASALAGGAIFDGDALTPQAGGLIKAGEAAYTLGILGLAAMTFAYPDRRRYGAGEKVALAIVAAAVAASLVVDLFARAGSDLGLASVGLRTAILSLQGLAALWLSRALGQGDERRRQSTRLIVLGLCVWPLWAVTLFGLALLTGQVQGRDALGFAGLVLALPALWTGYRLVRERGGIRWGLLGFLAAAVGLGVVAHVWPETARVTYLATVYTVVAVVTYGILRHDLFALDGKVRFAISKTTLAGIFVAVFFVGSEAAQQFFGETLGDAYIGIVAAGALVFVLAPLSRMADRLAEKAVPVTDGDGAKPVRKEQTYRDALAVALRDRQLTPSEEVTLARLAEDLGIGAGRAVEIRLEAERAKGSG